VAGATPVEPKDDAEFMDELNAELAKKGKEQDDADARAEAEAEARLQPGKKPAPSEVTDDAGDDAEPSTDGEDTPVDDALLERAVKAGLALADAKAFGGDPDALERLVTRLESSPPAAGKTDGKDDDKQESEEKDLLAEVPDLNPDQYDEDVVKAFAAVKAAMKQQQEFIGKLRKQVADADADSRNTWIDDEVGKLGKDFKDVFGDGAASGLPAGKQKAARDKLQRSIEFVQAEAKADGKSLPRSEAFKRALAIGFDDKIKALKGATAKEAAARRSATAINHPRTTSGKFSRDSEEAPGNIRERMKDAEAAVAELMESA